jgi:inhibin beta
VSCFEFTLPAGLSAGEVGTAQLMLYTLGGEEAGRNHSLQVWELTEPYHHRKSRRFQAYKMVDMSHEGWVTFDFQNSVKMWANEQSRTHVVEIECKSCRPGQPVEELGENAPILNLKLEPKGFQRRSRRRAPRSPHNLGACHPTHPGCCLHEHTINFKEEDPRLKDYIVQPERFRSNYCGGSCSFKVNPVHISMPSIRHKLLHNSSVAGQVLNMCCVPTKFSSLHILHYDEMGNLVRSAIPNMLATDCGCQI